jgi:hypothetical protein
MWPAGVRNRQYPDCTEFFLIRLLKKCMGLNFLDGMDKSPDYTESGLDKFYCIYSPFLKFLDVLIPRI